MLQGKAAAMEGRSEAFIKEGRQAGDLVSSGRVQRFANGVVIRISIALAAAVQRSSAGGQRERWRAWSGHLSPEREMGKRRSEVVFSFQLPRQ